MGEKNQQLQMKVSGQPSELKDLESSALFCRAATKKRFQKTGCKGRAAIYEDGFQTCPRQPHSTGTEETFLRSV